MNFKYILIKNRLFNYGNKYLNPTCELTNRDTQDEITIQGNYL